MRTAFKHVLILVIIGTFASTQQVYSENVFQNNEDLSLGHLVLTSGDFTNVSSPTFTLFHSDTLETYDIEAEEDEGPGFYKELAIFIIVAAIVGYMIAELIKPGDEDNAGAGSGGKGPEPPVSASLTVPFDL